MCIRDSHITPSPPLPGCGTASISWIWCCATTSPPRSIRLSLIHIYGTVEFKNVNSGDLGLETEEEKKAAEDATAENKSLFDAMKDALDGKVKELSLIHI